MREVLSGFGPPPLSLRFASNIVGSQRAIFFVQVRPISLLKTVSTADELKKRWADAPSTKETLVNLHHFVAAVGGVIKWIDRKSYRSAIIAAPASSFVSLPVVAVVDAEKVADGLDKLADTFLGAGAIIFGIGLAPEPASPGLLYFGTGVGSLGAGMKLGLGLWSLCEADDEIGTLEFKTVNAAADDPNAVQVVYERGGTDVKVETVIDLGDVDAPIDLGDIDALPPEPPEPQAPIDLGDIDAPPPPPPPVDEGGP
ncbi:hypothetical protein Q8F57_044870 [Paraburkholderia terrae]|uniref:hypothetical protein n=1 Tax=Paraburkholderia terrae TaxID=311230 RepID=UPI00296B13A7|nr:hypothetical protein [Paraburkholderia terrae]MDW3663751.1 hypothetical protein [Paraburkholderia terrae]